MIQWFKTNKALRLKVTQLEQELHSAKKNVGDLEHSLLKAQGRVQKKYREYPTVVLHDKKDDHLTRQLQVERIARQNVQKEYNEQRNEHGFPFGALVSKD